MPMCFAVKVHELDCDPEYKDRHIHRGDRVMRILAAMLSIPMFASASDSSRADFAWLEGCWESADQGSREVWVVEDERSLIGFSVTLDGASIAFYELLSIRADDDGSWTYNAHPSGQASAKFLASKIGANEVLFVNPEHDYPQEIRYRRDGDKLFASISMLDGEKPNSFDKVACVQAAVT